MLFQLLTSHRRDPMNSAQPHELCTIERTPGRIRLRIRHEPALLPGALTPTREGNRALRGFAREIASRLNAAVRTGPAANR
jgi:hypothetical protein